MLLVGAGGLVACAGDLVAGAGGLVAGAGGLVTGAGHCWRPCLRPRQGGGPVTTRT